LIFTCEKIARERFVITGCLISIMKNKKYSFYAIWLIAIVMLVLQLSSCTPAGAPRAEKGQLDLSSWDFKDEGIIKLDGEWEFYFGQLVHPLDFNGHADIQMTSFMDVPGVWNTAAATEKVLPPKGCATYRLRVRMPAFSCQYAFRILDAATAYRMYVNGRPVAENGIVSCTKDNAKAMYHPQVALLPPGICDTGTAGEKYLDIVVHVSNHHHIKAGLWESIRLGPANRIIDNRMRRVNIVIAVLAIIMIMVLYHLGLYVLRRRDPSTLLFGLMGFVLMTRELVMGERMLVQWIPVIDFQLLSKIEYIASYTNITFIALFVSSLFPGDMPRWMKNAYIAIGLCIALFVGTMPMDVYAHARILYDLFVLGGGIVIIGVIIRSIIRGRNEAYIALVGMLGLYGTAINDVLYNNHVINTFNMASLGLVFYIFSQSFLLSRRFSHAFTTVETLSHELVEKNRELTAMDSMKDEFLANTSHELRTPLNGIIGILDSVLDGTVGSLTPRQRQNLSLVNVSARRLATLVNDILDFSKMKNGSITLQQKPVDLYSLTDLVLMIQEPLAMARSIALVNNVDPDFPPVMGDENRIQQVLHNLVGNSIKFTPSGSVEVFAEYFEPAWKEPYIALHVKDTGIGIPLHRQHEIFDSFVQGDGSVSREYGGTGLGLAVSKKLVELMGGDLSVESEEGRGSIFTVTLTTAAEHDKTEQKIVVGNNGLIHEIHDKKQQESPTEHAVYDEPGKVKAATAYSILVVDDDPVNLQVLRNHLQGDEFIVTTAADGMKALEMIETRTKFDLILLDVMMPRMSGYQVCREIRKTRDQGEMPVIMITARNLISDLVTAFDAGANDYLVRPFDKRELLARVRTMMNLKEARREHEELVIMNEELNIAGRVQQQVLTSREMFSTLDNFDVDVVYLPQNGTVSGDYYNISLMEDGSTTFTVADVTGHGIQAALFTMQVDIVHKQSLKLQSPERRMDYLNRVFIRDLRTDSFFTAFLMQIIEGELYYASAGHPDQFLIRGATGEMVPLRGKGRILGFDQDSKYELKRETLQQGDVILLFSDGIYEEISTDGVLFGEERFISIVRELIDEGYCRGSMKELTSVIMERLHQHYEGMTYMDDITLMAIKIR